MSLTKVAHLVKCVIDRLAIAGTVDDDQGDRFVRELITESLSDRAIGAAAAAQMLSVDDLAFAYKAVIREHYPEVFISHGLVPILTASMPFIDSKHFPGFAATLGMGSSISDPPDTRREAIASNAVAFCRSLWEQATILGKARDKEWAFSYAKGRSQMPSKKGFFGLW